MLRARTLPPFVTHLLSASALLLATFAWIGCDSGSSGMGDGAVPDQISYDLTAQTDDGISGTVTFWRAGSDSTLVTLNLDGDATLPGVSHPAHIHNNSVSDGGGIEFYLSAVNGRSPSGTTARKIGQPIEFFADFDGHVNVHQSPANLDVVVAQGDIGGNAEGTSGEGLSFVDNPRATTYPLSASTTQGNVLSEGVSGTVRFEELTSTQTLVTYSLNTNGSVNSATEDTVEVAQIGHIHNNSVSEGGGIVSDPFSGYLGSVAPTDPAARSSRIINASYDDLTSYPGYVNIHEAVADDRRGYVFAQGNIGANAGTAGGADVTITVDNKGNSAWEVTAVSGASDVAQTGTENPTFTLELGKRYRIENNGGRSAHPFAVENGNEEYLLRQEGDKAGSLEGNADINYAEDDNGVTFTYTQTLADAAAAYQCTFHSSMEGSVEASSNDGGGY
ncbi:MAG: hypothetical protein ABEK75_06965 [Salinibacter sp.]